MPNGNYKRRSSADACIATSQWGLGREVWAALSRVRTGPECPEDSLRGLA